MQSARTSQMIFDVPRTIEFLSSFTTLRPGDVIATGTPGGVGFARKPPVWLTPGDTIEVTIEGVGTDRQPRGGRGAPTELAVDPPAVETAPLIQTEAAPL